MHETTRSLATLDRVGGHPALDFVNTVESWQNGRPGNDYLSDYGALEDWHRVTGLIAARGLRQLASGSLRARREALRRAGRLRGALHRLFAAVARGDPPPQPALDELQDVLRRTVGFRLLTARGRQIGMDWDFSGASPHAIVGPVAWQAAELLEHGPLDRIKACPPTDGCGWLFLDLSRNRSRTWCSMKTCGNTAKVRRFRARHSSCGCVA